MKEIPNKGTIAVPNDTSNESRALYVLESAGLIKLDTKAGALAPVKDITENPKDLTIKELDGSQTASALSSVDAAVVNNDFSVPAGLTNKEVIANNGLTLLWHEKTIKTINFTKMLLKPIKPKKQKNYLQNCTLKKEQFLLGI